MGYDDHLEVCHTIVTIVYQHWPVTGNIFACSAKYFSSRSVTCSSNIVSFEQKRERSYSSWFEINRDNGVKFQKYGCPLSNNTTTDRYHSGLLREQRLFGTKRIKIINNHSEDQNAPIINNHGATNCDTRTASRHHRLIRPIGKWSKRRDPHQSY